jgi:uncharacterized membrane protein
VSHNTVRPVGVVIALGILAWGVFDLVPALTHFGAPWWLVFLAGAVVGGMAVLIIGVFQPWKGHHDPT